jgi:hypothetical protein
VPLLNCEPLAAVKTRVQSVTFSAPGAAPPKSGAHAFVTATPISGLTGIDETGGFDGQT